MKKIKVLLAALICVFALSFNAQAQKKTAQKGAKIEKTTKANKASKFKQVAYKVNIHCEDCKNEIESSIPFVKGVKNLKVDMSTNIVTVDYDPKKTDPETIKKAFSKIDFIAEKVS